MGNVISVCNLKGGAGKSTIAVNVACQIADSTGEPCAVIDADRQGTAAAWAAAGRLPVKVLAQPLGEARAEDRYPGMIWTTQVARSGESYAHLVIDLPAGLQYSLAAVTAVSDLILVPVNPSGVDFHATRQFIGLIERTRKVRGSGRPACIIVPNRLDARTGVARDLAVYEQFGETVAAPVFSRKIHADAFDAGRWIGDIAPGSASHAEIERLAATVLAPPAPPASPPAGTVAAYDIAERPEMPAARAFPPGAAV